MLKLITILKILITILSLLKITSFIHSSLKNNKNENTANLSAITNNGDTKEGYLTPAIGIISKDPNSEDPRARIRQEVQFADVGALDEVATRQADQQYNYFSNLPAGINTIIDMLEDDSAVQRKGNKFTITVPGADGKIATTTKGVRNLNSGKLLGETTELEIDFPEYDENSPNDVLFKGDFSDQLKEYFKFKSFAANGAYSYSKASKPVEYDRIELEENKNTVYNDLLTKVYSIDGGSLTKDQLFSMLCSDPFYDVIKEYGADVDYIKSHLEHHLKEK